MAKTMSCFLLPIEVHLIKPKCKFLTAVNINLSTPCSCCCFYYLLYESHTLFLLLGANVPASQQAISPQFFFSRRLLAAFPRCLFLSTLPCLSPPSLTQIPPPPPLPFSLPCSKTLHSDLCVREKHSDCVKELMRQEELLKRRE